ncbi:MAG: radical SAM family heme chaperone HemW [Planctomycetes bacterium]|nr:radical SAM family heme chaperone HemW [Planctomycetota bacterium]
MGAVSLYVHVPFCVVKCGYCDFNSFAGRDVAEHDRFLAALDAELALLAPPRVPRTVFVGGGTPTHLDEERFARLFAVLARHVDLPRVTEVTMEANPESVTLPKARIARDAGVGRVSVGVQSFAAERLRFLDRPHDAAAVGRAVAALRAAGFDNVSLDLIFGVPGQELADWDRDLDAALALEPDHLSCYSLTFEPGTRLERDRRQGRVAPNEDRVDAALFLHTRDRLGAAGFDAYEISNFAGRGGPCLHNDHYWTQGDYLGAGPGAASHRDGWRGTNLKPLHAWATVVERGFVPSGEAETLSRRHRLAEALWLGLRRRDGVDLAQAERRLGVAAPVPLRAQLAAWIESGHLAIEGARYRLTPRGLLVADAIGASLL